MGNKFTQQEVVEFLLGNEPLDGVWYGERHPKEPGAYWWRKYLREVIPARITPPKRRVKGGKGRK